MIKEIKDVHPGDYIVGSDGNTYLVTDETEIHLPHQMFRITFSNGTIECSGDHRWRYWLNGVDFLTDTYDLFLNLEWCLEQRPQIGKKDSEVYIENVEEIQPELVKCIMVDSPDQMFKGYTNEGNEIFFSNCGFRVFCGKATEAGSSMVALDNTLATTIDSTHPGAGIIQSLGKAEFCRFYFSEFKDLQEYYRLRGLDPSGYSGNSISYDELEDLSGDEEITLSKDKVTFEFEEEKVDIDKRQDQDWDEVKE